MDKNRINISIPAVVLGVCVIISTLIATSTFYRIRSFDNSLSVTGSAKKAITADHVKWVAMFTHNAYASNLKSGYDVMARDLVSVKQFYKDQGFAEMDLNISPVYVDQIYKQNENAEKEYTLRQNVELSSSDVQKVTAMTKNTQSLIYKGVVFSSQYTEYTYSKLSELRVSLLADALKDAKARAEQIAQSGGEKVGKLKSAASGVVQVLPLNSVEVSDYGTYDTQSIEKEVMVTVKAAFTLK